MKDVDWWVPGGESVSYALVALPDYLMHQRWFPVKDGGTPVVSVDQSIALSVEGQRAALVVWRVNSANRGALRVCMPLALVDEAMVNQPGVLAAGAIVGRLPNCSDVLIDATALDPVVRALVAAMIDAPMHPAGAADRRGELSFHRTPAIGAFMDAAGSGDWSIKRGRVEQSNTSIRVGAGAIFKLIRKLERGVHPELEMGRFLTERAHFAAAPALLGWIDAGDTTIAILQAFVANDGDGWTWLLERLRSDPATAGLNWLHTLGERTGELHVALASDAADPAFAPEDIVPADWQAWKTSVLMMSQRAARALQESAGAIDDRARHAASDYSKRMVQLESILDGLLLGPGMLQKTRHHGDFHLGQVLVHHDDAVIVDFEGEPMRPLAERRAKHCALRDVAGMLRSLAYAAAVAGLSGDEWLDTATARFLEGYFARGLSGPGCPRDRGAALRLVQFFTIEKALYEVLYELANRPAWVGIPLIAVNQLLSAAARQRDDRTA